MSQAFDQQVDVDAIDIAHQTLRLAADLAVWPAWENGTRVFRLELRDAKRFYRVGHREYIFLSLLNGSTTVASACGLAASRLGNEALSIDEAESVVIWLIEEGIATLEGDTSANSSFNSWKQGMPGGNNAKKPGLLQKLNPFWIQIPVIKNARWIERWLQFPSKCLHPSLLVVGVLLIAVGCVVFFLNREAVYDSASNLFTPSGWISLLCTWVVLKFIHEAGHALACERVGGETGEVGIVLILFAPLAYVDVSSCWRLSRLRSRLFVSAAGMFFELMVAGIAMIAWLMTDDPLARYWLANVVVIAGVSTVLFNANPLMRFDGYYLLSDLVQIPNLATEGTLELKRISRRLVYGESNGGGHYRGTRRIFVICYGIAALIWRVFICVVLAVTASVMFSGAGIALALLGVIGWFGKPTWSFISDADEIMREHPMRFIRGLAVMTAFIISIAWAMTSPIPTRVRIAGVVQDPPEAVVRSGTEGFIRQIHVKDGQFVEQGAPLVTLQNRELQEELKQLTLSLDENAIIHRMATDLHDASGEWMALQDRVAIEKKIDQIQPRVRSLTITAPHAGKIACRELPTMLGSYVREGDEIVRVVGAQPSEVIGLVHQDRIAIAKANVGQAVSIRDPSRNSFTGRLRLVDPRASHEVLDPSLAAPNGGPLEVTRGDHDEDDDTIKLNLVDPHFVARTDLDPVAQEQLRTGTRVTIGIGHREDSLATRLAMAFDRFRKRAK